MTSLQSLSFNANISFVHMVMNNLIYFYEFYFNPRQIKICNKISNKSLTIAYAVVLSYVNLNEYDCLRPSGINYLKIIFEKG